MKQEKFEIVQKIKKELKCCKKKFEENKEMDNPCGEEGYVAYGTKIKDGKEVPNCIPVDEDMSKIIKEGFPIPSPSGDEDEQTFVSRCMEEIGGEYDQEQALAICYNKYREGK